MILRREGLSVHCGAGSVYDQRGDGIESLGDDALAAMVRVIVDRDAANAALAAAVTAAANEAANEARRMASQFTEKIDDVTKQLDSAVAKIEAGRVQLQAYRTAIASNAAAKSAADKRLGKLQQASKTMKAAIEKARNSDKRSLIGDFGIPFRKPAEVDDVDEMSRQRIHHTVDMLSKVITLRSNGSGANAARMIENFFNSQFVGSLMNLDGDATEHAGRMKKMVVDTHIVNRLVTTITLLKNTAGSAHNWCGFCARTMLLHGVSEDDRSIYWGSLRWLLRFLSLPQACLPVDFDRDRAGFRRPSGTRLDAQAMRTTQCQSGE